MPGNCSRNWRDVGGLEHLVDRAMAPPEQNPGCLDRPRRCCRPGASRGSQTGIWSSGMPIARAVLRPRCWSGKKRARRRRGERPVEHGPRVRAGADDAAVPAAERLQLGRRVDVGHRHQIVGVDDLAEVGPGGLDGVEVGHVGHAATRAPGRAGKPGPRRARGIGRLRHEMDAAEDDRPAGLAGRGKLAELETVAAKVGELDHVVLLVMMAQDQEGLAQSFLAPADPLIAARNRPGCGNLRRSEARLQSLC